MNASNHGRRTPHRLVASLVIGGVIAFSAVAVGAPQEAPFGAYLGSCHASSDCSEGLYCYEFSKLGPHCTRTCASNSDCASPSRGCSERHQCAMPK